MTTKKGTATGKEKKVKKLTLKKETITDLDAGTKAAKVKGGRTGNACFSQDLGCYRPGNAT
jgi:hypothetical protein